MSASSLPTPYSSRAADLLRPERHPPREAVILRHSCRRLPTRRSRHGEEAAYFVVSEALANIAKYANAQTVLVRVAYAAGTLTVDVIDDGSGGADPARGSGLRGLSDRIAAVDGSLVIDSRAGSGTRRRARIPADSFGPRMSPGAAIPA
jgi:signal transduction histidine kinase